MRLCVQKTNRYAGNYFYEKRFHSFGPAKMDALTKILTVAVDSFRQYGFKTITMDDIARGAGISKKTLYQHFYIKAGSGAGRYGVASEPYPQAHAGYHGHF